MITMDLSLSAVSCTIMMVVLNTGRYQRKFNTWLLWIWVMYNHVGGCKYREILETVDKTLVVLPVHFREYYSTIFINLVESIFFINYNHHNEVWTYFKHFTSLDSKDFRSLWHLAAKSFIVPLLPQQWLMQLLHCCVDCSWPAKQTSLSSVEKVSFTDFLKPFACRPVL